MNNMNEKDCRGFMEPKCDFVKYELFKNALLDAIRDAIPKETFDDFSQYL